MISIIISLGSSQLRTSKHAVRVFNQSRLAQEASVRARLSKGSMRDREFWSCVKTAGGARKSSTIPLLINTSGGEHASSKGKNRFPRLIFCQQMQSRPTRPPGRAASPTATATHPAFILHPLPASRGLEITRETEHLQSNWPGHHIFQSAQRMLERTCYANYQIVCSMLSHGCAARHVEDSQRCSHSQALIQSHCLQLPASIITACHVKGDGDHYQQATDEPSGLP